MWEGLSPPYSTIVADPPWRYASAATKADARKHYTTTSTDNLAELPVAALAAPDAHLWCWATNALMEVARQPRLGWDHWGHGYEGQVA